jgi:hypothetical protein
LFTEQTLACLHEIPVFIQRPFLFSSVPQIFTASKILPSLAVRILYFSSQIIIALQTSAVFQNCQLSKFFLLSVASVATSL